MDWFYALAIRADGDFELVIDRGKLGRCLTHATLIQSAPPTFSFAVSLDECHRDRPPGRITAGFSAFTGKAVTLELTNGDEVTHHAYTRAPAQ